MSDIEPAYRLTVKAITRETELAKSFTLAPERDDESHFVYKPGQFITFRLVIEGQTLARSYSLSSAASCDRNIAVCVKRIPDGRVSNWMNDRLVVGARVHAFAPAGRFVLSQNELPAFFVAGGSGITPCLSMIKHALFSTQRKLKLVYVNSSFEQIIYRATIDQLLQRFPDRFSCTHWLTQDKGRIGPMALKNAFSGWESSDVHICGPDALMNMAEETLNEITEGKARIVSERFLSPDAQSQEALHESMQAEATPSFATSCTMQYNGVSSTFELPDTETIVDAARNHDLDIPHSCTEGHCGACMAKLVSGEINMASAKALSKRNLERGFILACQAKPVSRCPVSIDFDI